MCYVTPVFSFSKHTDSWLSNCPCVHVCWSYLCLCRLCCSYNWIHIQHIVSPHSSAAMFALSLPVTFWTTLRPSDPLIGTWTANSGSVVFVVCALSASSESCTQHAESIRFYMKMYACSCVWEAESVCFGLLSYHDGAVYDFHVEVSPGWLAGCFAVWA